MRCKATPLNNSKTRLFVLYSQNYAARALPILFNTPKNPYSNQATPKNTCQIFVPKKIPEPKISNPKKSFDDPRHLESRVTPWDFCIRQFHLRPAPPPPPRATAGHLPALSVPGVRHLQILHCSGAGHLPTPGPFPSFQTRTRFPIRM